MPATRSPLHPASAQPAVGALTAEEAQAFALPQPSVHPLLVARVYDELGSQFPDLKAQFDQARQCILALNRLQLRAVHAACYQEQQDQTLEALADQWSGYLQRPAELLAFVDRQLAKVEGKSAEAAAVLARGLPEVFQTLEKLPIKLPAPEEAAGPHVGPSSTQLRAAVIKAMIEVMAAKDPAARGALEQLGSRLDATSTEEMRLIHADMWQDSKAKTLNQATDQLAVWFDRPATFLAEMQQRLARLEGIGPQARADLLSSYPEALSRMEDLILAQPRAAVAGAPPAGSRIPGMRPGSGMGAMPGMQATPSACPCPMMRKGAGQPDS